MASGLILTSVPDRSLVYSNIAYVDSHLGKTLGLQPTDSQFVHHYQVNDRAIYISSAHEQVMVCGIGLNLFQRQDCKVTIDKPVKISLPHQKLLQPASKMHFTLDFINDKPPAVEIAEEELIAHIMATYLSHVLMRDQTIAVNFKGIGLKLQLVDFELESKENVTHGMLVLETKITVRPSSDFPRLTWTPSSRASSFFKPTWNFESMGIGGLDAEFQDIFRRAFASRLYPQEIVQKFNIKHVRGMVLYGPPGCGKTLIARQISKMLSQAEPKIVNGPEILSPFVGQSEANTRALFTEAEKEYKEKGDRSKLHVIILDEFDAICPVRGSDRNSTGTRDTVVNQLLSKIDGVESLNNILLIGLTNRLDMIDPAMLRPGRLEIHVEIKLPDEPGRLQILKIHTKTIAESKALHEDVDLKLLASQTKNFSGAELEGLVKSATSFALYGNFDVTQKQEVEFKAEQLKQATLQKHHFEQALEEITPVHGTNTDELKRYTRGNLYFYGTEFTTTWNVLADFADQLKQSKRTSVLSVLLQGPTGAGKTTIAAQMAARTSGFGLVKIISAEQLLDIGSERGKCLEIVRIFEEQAYKSPSSLIILDDIEQLLEYIDLAGGVRFSNAMLQTLLTLLKRTPPDAQQRLLVLGTTSRPEMMEQLGLDLVFNATIDVPLITSPFQVASILRKDDHVAEECKETEEPGVTWDLVALIEQSTLIKHLPIDIKKLLLILDMAKEQDSIVLRVSRLNDAVMKYCKTNQNL